MIQYIKFYWPLPDSIDGAICSFLKNGSGKDPLDLSLRCAPVLKQEGCFIKVLRLCDAQNSFKQL